ncbi:MAG: hypothetical protein M1829_006655 [Trizodia sp. TS-e1964]|nr:MAG: hypothetical protein M1829_006655 [Trizodia sp. TS-e1964]
MQSLTRPLRPLSALQRLALPTSAHRPFLPPPRPYTTAPPPTRPRNPLLPPLQYPLLPLIRTDLKTALRTKDKHRLSALRAVLAASTNLEKESFASGTEIAPWELEERVFELLRKQAAVCTEAADQARSQGREEMVRREEAQAKVLHEYVALWQEEKKRKHDEIVADLNDKYGRQ